MSLVLLLDVAPRPVWAADPRSGDSLLDELSVDHHRKLLASAIEADRLRALDHLARLGTSQSLNALNGTVSNVVTRGTLLEGRTLIELLFEHAADPQSLHSLSRIVTGAAANNKGNGIHPFLRAMAAMALAENGSTLARAALSQALSGDPQSAEYAARALRAHPPTSLDFLAGGANPNVTLARLVGDLGDQRAFHVLRRWIREGGEELQNAAAFSLTRLGDYETAELARHWLGQQPSLERQRIATEILLVAGAKDGEAALLELERNPQQVDAFLDLGLRFPTAGLVDPILGRIDSATEEELPSLITILARAGTAKAIAYLGASLADSRRASLASFALGQSTSPLAANEIRHALQDERRRSWALCSALLRQLHFDESGFDLNAGFESLARSKNPTEVALGVWGLSALDEGRARKELLSGNPKRIAAAARTALIQGKSFFELAAERLAATRSAEERFLLSFALAYDEVDDKVPTDLLLALASRGTASGALAAYALARRDNPELRPTLIEFLNGSNAMLRAHIALGLAASRNPSASGLLVHRYRLELDWRVRWAIVTALGQRHELPRNKILALASHLDPSIEVQNAARLASSSSFPKSFPRGTASAMIRLKSIVNTISDASPGALLELNPALALPFAPDPDGVLVILGVPDGPIELQVAAPPDLSKSSARANSAAPRL